MQARPGSIGEVIDVGLARPRKVGDREVAGLRDDIVDTFFTEAA
jgi:sulfonate transport system ATP-binding protein